MPPPKQVTDPYCFVFDSCAELVEPEDEAVAAWLRNVLDGATVSRPIENAFTLNAAALRWLTEFAYEDPTQWRASAIICSRYVITPSALREATRRSRKTRHVRSKTEDGVKLYYEPDVAKFCERRESD